MAGVIVNATRTSGSCSSTGITSRTVTVQGRPSGADGRTCARTYSSSSAPYCCTVLTESNGNGFSQPIASSPIGSVNSASISVRWRRNTTAELGMGWPHAGSAATRSRRAGRSRRIDASEGEFGAVVGQTVPPDRVDMVATLRGELDPDAWPVDDARSRPDRSGSSSPSRTP